MGTQGTQYWVIADTHFGHSKLRDHYGWPMDFEKRILKSIQELVKPKDVLIHLGDINFYNDAKWHELIRTACSGKQWLIKGNHDKKSNSWYIDHGWDFVANNIEVTLFNKNIIFSHRPINTIDEWAIGEDFNVHGHLHQKEPRYQYQKLVATENTWRPINLRRIIESPLQVF